MRKIAFAPAEMWVVLVSITMGVSNAAAQYDEPREEPLGPPRYAGVTVGHRNFSPRGTGTIDYSTLVVGLILHQDPVELQFGYAAYSLGAGDRQSLSLSTTVGFDLPLAPSGRGTGVMIPLLITADYTKAEASGLERDNFNVASIGAGTGLKGRLAGDRWEVTMRAAVAAQYSFEGFSVGTGFSPLVLAEATAVLRSVPLLDGMAIGYRFRWQDWNMSEDLFDYRSMEHTLFLGVLF